jgi:hypothetical protein
VKTSSGNAFSQSNFSDLYFKQNAMSKLLVKKGNLFKIKIMRFIIIKIKSIYQHDKKKQTTIAKVFVTFLSLLFEFDCAATNELVIFFLLSFSFSILSF